MADTFANRFDKSEPGERHFAVVPSDTVEMAIRPRAIFCATAGTAQVVDAAGTLIAYPMAAGDILPFRPLRINATGTTGTYVGWY
jgi:hypothetical protein